MKHFQAFQRARPKSSTATTGSKRQRGNTKRELPHDPSSLTLKEQTASAQLQSSTTGSAFDFRTSAKPESRPVQRQKATTSATPGSRLLAPTKSSQAKAAGPLQSRPWL